MNIICIVVIISKLPIVIAEIAVKWCEFSVLPSHSYFQSQNVLVLSAGNITNFINLVIVSPYSAGSSVR